MKTTILFSCLLAFTAATMVSGCGGGTSSVPTVTAKPKSAAKTVVVVPKTKKPGDPPEPKGSGPGTFDGTVIYDDDGVAPAIGAPAGFTDMDKFCAANKANVKELALVVDPNSKGVKNVFVYLVKKPKGVAITAAPTEPVKFDQKNCTFSPQAFIIRTNQPVLVSNSDDTNHNAHTNPLNAASAAYNKSLSLGQTDQYVYAGAEKIPVKVVCDIHAWMSAYQLPLDHQFFALTDKDGKFSISGLPPGDYKFRLWHGEAGYLEKAFDVFIVAGQTTKEDFKYAPAKFTGFHGPAPKTVVVSITK